MPLIVRRQLRDCARSLKHGLARQAPAPSSQRSWTAVLTSQRPGRRGLVRT
jgi:hypothetical protein